MLRYELTDHWMNLLNLKQQSSCFIPMKGYINLSSNQSSAEALAQDQTAISKHYSKKSHNYNRSVNRSPKCSLCKIIAIILVIAFFIALSMGALTLQSQRHIISEIMSFLQNEKTNPQEDSSQIQYLQEKSIAANGQPNSLKQQQINHNPLRQGELNKEKIQPQKFIIPKNVWIFVESGERQTYFVQRCIKNIRWFALKSGFQLRFVNSKNYGQWLTGEQKKRVQNLLKHLKIGKDENSVQKKVKIQLIMMQIMLEKGGIVIDKNIILTQDFTWLERINENIYVNRARSDSKAQYFGFFNLDFGTFSSKADKKTQYETQKYIIKFPGLLGLFFAGVAKGEYLQETLPWFYKIIEQPSNAKILMKTYDIFAGNITGKDPYKEAFVIASHIVLQRKQREINKNNRGQIVYSIDYYGLLTINSRYFPTKLQAVFQSAFQQKVYRNLAKYSLDELEESAGPLRYMVSLFFEQHMNYRLEGAKNGNHYYDMHPDSFFARYLYMDGKYPFIWKEYEKSTINITAKKWDSLPKIVWLFWDTGISRSTLANKLCVQNIRKYTEQVGFQIRMVNNSNIESYIGKQTIERIDNIAQSRKIQIFAPMKSNFYRIALMSKYGGIYMDVSFFVVENFGWLLDIARYPSQSIFNRYGELPKMFMFFHPHYGSLFDWKYDPHANTKMAWLASYQNNLIVGEPNQKIMEDWFNTYEQFITSPYEESEKLMQELNIFTTRWTNSKHTYLAAMESLRMTFGLKQKEIQLRPPSPYGPKSAPEYYGIWSMSGFRGQQKFRPHTNYDKNNFRDPYSYDNFFLYRYSKQYTDGVIGKVHQMGKFYRWTIKHLNKFIEQNIDNGFKEEAHPDSYFMRFIYDTSRLKIERRNGELVIVK